MSCHKCHNIYYFLLHHIYPWAHSVLVLYSKDVSFTGLQFSGIPLRHFRKLIYKKSILYIPGLRADSRVGWILDAPKSVVQLFYSWVLQDSQVRAISSNLSLPSSSSTSLGVTTGLFFCQGELETIKTSKKVWRCKNSNLSDGCGIFSPKIANHTKSLTSLLPCVGQSDSSNFYNAWDARRLLK